jgi:hypothetical protein
MDAQDSGCSQLALLSKWWVLLIVTLVCRMWTTAAVGALCLAVFCWGQSFVSVYRGRMVSEIRSQAQQQQQHT